MNDNADETTVEGNSEQAGEQEQSTSAASQEQSQVLPEYAKAILSRLDAMEKQVKGVQKGTDKQIKHQVTSSIDRIIELAKSNKTKPEIERELWIDQMMQGSGASDGQIASDKSEKPDGFDLAVVDEVLGLPANDSRVTDLKVKYGKDPKAYLGEGLKLAAKLADQQESTPAEQPMQSGAAKQKIDNPIAEIEDPKTLYRMAAKQIVAQANGRKRSVPS